MELYRRRVNLLLFKLQDFFEIIPRFMIPPLAAGKNLGSGLRLVIHHYSALSCRINDFEPEKMIVGLREMQKQFFHFIAVPRRREIRHDIIPHGRQAAEEKQIKFNIVKKRLHSHPRCQQLGHLLFMLSRGFPLIYLLYTNIQHGNKNQEEDHGRQK